MIEIKFKRDTSFRKQFFVPDSFAHPAKMDAQLLIWIVEKYSKVGETILDPMAGSGTMMLACTLGRDVVMVELEDKFCKMMRDNWEEVKMRPQLGYQMGNCQIIQGDARQLGGVLNKCIFSPPYAESDTAFHDDKSGAWYDKKKGRALSRAGELQDNIGNLPYGSIDKIVTSPPFQEQKTGGQQGAGKYSGTDLSQGLKRVKDDYAGVENPDHLGNLPYGNIDAVVTSPPYEGSVSASTGGERDQSSARQREARLRGKGYDPAKYQGGVGRNLEVDFQYSKDDENIGNLKNASYLEAMLQVYAQCWSVLKPGGLMVLVTKNFIRNKQVIRLDTDTIKLCEQAGFTYLERHYRLLTSVSFWRIIYKQRYPDAPEINREDILVFKK